MRFIFGISLIFVSFLQPALANTVCRQEVCFPASVSAESPPLRLQGTGLFRYLLMDIYSAALYLEPAAETTAWQSADVGKALILHYHRDIPASRFRQSAEATLSRQLGPNAGALAERIERLHAAYRSVKAGDRYTLLYTPQRGTRLLLNDEALVTIEGADFANAYFGIWLRSREPLSEDLRAQLMSGTFKQN